LEQQSPRAAAGYLRLLTTADPYRESAHRQLMQALAASGDYAAATLIYRELRLMLHRELNTAPCVETTALYDRIREEARGRTTPSLPLAPVSGPTAPPGPRPAGRLPCPLTPFIGRAHEVQDARERLVSARLVTLAGSGGVGKTRLAIRIAEEET